MTYFKLIEQLCASKGITIEALSRAVNVPEEKIRSWNRRNSRPDYFRLIDIAEYLGVPIEVFVLDNYEE